MTRQQNITPVQQSFLGASIRSFSGEVGWNETPTTLNVALVEDRRKNEIFNPPLVGSPVEFNFRKDPTNPDPNTDFYYAGILNKKEEDRSEGGNRLLNVTLADPRVFLDGVQLIVNDFTKPILGIDNIYNIFAFYEDNQYGSSLVNSLGMRSELIYDALDNMINARPIKFGLYEYFIDITEIPKIKDDYRISQNIISLSSFISDCCDVANLDYLCELVRVPGFGWVIKFRTIQRGYIPTPGSLISFLDTVEDVNQRNFGIEYNYQATRSKVVIGAQVDYLFFQTRSTGTIIGSGSNSVVVNPDAEEDDQVTISVPETTRIDNGNIAKFWGEDFNNNLIFSRLNPGFIDPDDEVVVVPAYEIGFPYYVISMGELRAASVSQDSWEAFITLNDYPGSIHQNKSSILRLNAEVKKNLKLLFDNTPLQKLTPLMIQDIFTKYQHTDQNKIFVEKVYSFIRRYATEFFGVKYSVSIPQAKVRVDQDDFRKKVTSIIPNESGYLSDQEILTVILNGLMPEYFPFVQDDLGKITPYVKYDNFDDLSLLELTPGEDYIIDYDFVRIDGTVVTKKNIYVKCQIEDKVYFGNGILGTDPRVVITLPSPVYKREIRDRNTVLAAAYFKSQNVPFRDEDGNFIDPDAAKAISIAAFNSIIGSDALLFDADPYPKKPDVAIVPLRDTLNTYGPWQAGGESGRVEIEQNQDMAPWNFGGYINMNVVGERLVRDILIQSVENEVGSVTIPGVYNIGPGTQLPNNGPYVNGFNVNIGNDGLQTSFRYGKPEIKTGKMIEYQISRIRKEFDLRKDIARTKRDFYKKVLGAPIVPNNLRKKEDKKQRRNRPNSSSPMIMGQALSKEDSDKLGSSVATMPGYNVGQFIAEEFDKKGGMSLDGLFRPYEVNGDGEFLPVYSLPEDSEDSDINSRKLFPFAEGHDVTVVFKGQEPSEDIQNDVFKVEVEPEPPIEGVPESSDGDEEEEEDVYDENVRPLALKGPLVVAGWGFDTDGKPVPNEDENDPTDEFLEDYLTKSNEWKVGPVDLKWDRGRKVWSGGTEILEGVLTSAISPIVPSTFTVSVRDSDWNEIKEITCTNRDPSLEVTDFEDIFVIVARINSVWRPIWVGCENG